jgi:hypothetical protein
MAVAVTAAIGIERLIQRRVPGRIQAAAWGLSMLVIALAYLCSPQVMHNEVLHLRVPREMVKLALELPAGLLGVAALLLIDLSIYKPSQATGRVLAVGMTILLFVEMSLCFIAPVYYWFNQLPADSHNPYAGAPYLNEIRKDQGYYRTFARDGLLFPNWASAFRIYDIRNLDAMYDKKYFPFLVNFFPDQKNTPSPFDLGDRFNGTGPYDVTTSLAERLLQLSSVKYIASIRAFTIPNGIVDEILAQNRGHLLPGREANIARREFILGGEARDALGEHPPYERMPYHFRVGNDREEILHFSYALDPLVFDKVAGDGVEFILELKDSTGKITKLFSRYIDPKHNAGERRWVDGEADLDPWRGQTVELLLTTTPGPKGDTSYDWAAWSDFYFEGHERDVQGQPPPFKLIYNAEAKLYRYDHVLPRAAIYHHAALAASEADELKRLVDPSLNVFNTAVLDNSALSAAQRAMISKINNETPVPVQAAHIKSYQSQEVVIEASLTGDGILALNDTDYPGWTAQIDGQPAQVINANYMFRGVLLPAGSHLVRFAYRPRNFYAALAIGVATLAVLTAGALVVLARKRRPTAHIQREISLLNK